MSRLHVHTLLLVDHEARTFGSPLELGTVGHEQRMGRLRIAFELELAPRTVHTHAQETPELRRREGESAGVGVEHDFAARHRARLLDDSIDLRAVHARQVTARRERAGILAAPERFNQLRSYPRAIES